LLEPYLVFLLLLTLKRIAREGLYTFFAIQQIQQSFLHLQHIKLSLDGVGLWRLVRSLWIPVAIILRIYVRILQVKPRFIRKECQLLISISPSTTDCRNQLQKWALLARSRGCKTCVGYCCL
jgi:hypothetical protein